MCGEEKKNLKGNSESRISFAQSLELTTSVHVYASGLRWTTWLFLAKFSVGFRNP